MSTKQIRKSFEHSKRKEIVRALKTYGYRIRTYKEWKSNMHVCKNVCKSNAYSKPYGNFMRTWNIRKSYVPFKSTEIESELLT